MEPAFTVPLQLTRTSRYEFLQSLIPEKPLAGSIGPFRSRRPAVPSVLHTRTFAAIVRREQFLLSPRFGTSVPKQTDLVGYAFKVLSRLSENGESSGHAGNEVRLESPLKPVVGPLRKLVDPIKLRVVALFAEVADALTLPDVPDGGLFDGNFLENLNFTGADYSELLASSCDRSFVDPNLQNVDAASIETVLQVFMFVFVVRIILTWLPNRLEDTKFVEVLKTATDPYLNLFRWIPPLGGADMSIVVAYFFLQGVQSYLPSLLA